MEASTKLLIGQWSNAENLKQVIQIFLDLVSDQIMTPIADLNRMRNIETAGGVYLDYLGVRVGLPRPFAQDKDSELEFGFDDAGIGFDQGRFLGQDSLESLSPVSDGFYRLLIRVRALSILPDHLGAVKSMTDAINLLDDDATTADRTDMGFTVTAADDDDILLAYKLKLLPRPAGVGLQ